MKVTEGKKIYTVSEVNYIAKQTLEQMPFWVEGEISEVKINPNWSFYYLKIKDDFAILPCIVSGYLLKETEENLLGQKLLVSGYLSLYEQNGQYQFRINALEFAGEGQMAKKLEELIGKLKSEGLFDPKHKKPLPEFPKKICLVTSLGSDAERDFITHSITKFPLIELSEADIRVQGTQSVTDILRVLPRIDLMAFDIIVLTRGGGSLEDLAAFNDERVARAIFSLKTPVIVAIGHESNESLAEWVADRRASTPTDAANIAVGSYAKVLESLNFLKSRLVQETDYYFSANLQKLDHYYFCLAQVKNIFKDLPHRLDTISGLLGKSEKVLIFESEEKSRHLEDALKRSIVQIYENKKINLENLEKSLRLLSPENVLMRGYSITSSENGNIIRNINQVEIGDNVKVKVSGGFFKAGVKSKNNGK